jgi:hypothetical protein
MRGPAAAAARNPPWSSRALAGPGPLAGLGSVRTQGSDMLGRGGLVARRSGWLAVRWANTPGEGVARHQSVNELTVAPWGPHAPGAHLL